MPEALLDDLRVLPKFEQQGRVRVPQALEGDPRQFVELGLRPPDPVGPAPTDLVGRTIPREKFLRLFAPDA